VPQAYENAKAGVKRLATETGAGQWGSSLAFACSLFGLECEVFMVGSSYDQKPYRRSMMETWGATVHRSPSTLTESGRSQQAHPTGSLGIAISEAVEVAAGREDTNYSLGSVLNHVCLHQTVIGQEAMAQMGMAGEEPDVIIGCVGGGSNFAGLTFPFVRRVLRGEAKTRFLAAEPAACPTLTRGVYRYDFGDTVGLTPLMAMYTLGHDFVPAPVHAGGLRYHGDAPMLCGLVRAGVVEARAYRQNETFEAAVQFARCEGIIPAPEPAHAIRAVVEEAEAAREAGEARVILFGLCGHGHFDLSAYDAYLAGELEDVEFSEEEMEAALARLPEAPVIG
jgi:tryptophan synthase beta chain